MKNYLFSLSAVVLSLGALTYGGFALKSFMPPTSPIEEPKVAPPPTEVPATVPVLEDSKPAVIELDEVPPAPIRKHPKVQANQIKASPAAPKAKEWVCESKWNDSILFADGSRYRNCSWK